MLSSKKGPLKTFDTVPSCGPASNMSFGEPGDGSLILVAAAATGGAGGAGAKKSGELLYFRCKTSKSEPKHRTSFPEDCCPVVVNWHPTTQQIAVGCTDGTCRVFFDEEMSSKGAMMLSTSSSTTVRVRKSTGYARIGSDSLIQNDEEMRGAAQKKRRKVVDAGSFDIGPERPDQDLKDVGKRGDQKSFTQTVMKYRTKNSIVLNTDPREAILKYHTTDGATGEWIGAAYAKSDPVHVLAKTTLEEEDEEEIAEGKK